jgi:hypothetical protein
MRPFLAAITAALTFCACPPGPVVPGPPAPDSQFCPAACDHIGPNGLNCPEGQPLYNESLPGEAGVPNETCTQFCQAQQQNAIFLNPRCLMQVPTCADIEAWRQKDCTTD